MPIFRSNLPTVSILGLVDKGLRRYRSVRFTDLERWVSILGLVDKGLRRNIADFLFYQLVCFNPWFSG